MKKEKLQIVILVLIVVVGIGYAYTSYLLKPELAVIQAKQEEIASKQEYYRSLLSYTANPQLLDQQIQTQQTELAKIRDFLPAAIDQPQIIYDIYIAVKQNNLTAESVTLETPEKKDLYQVMGLSFSVLGNPNDILNIIKELNNSSDGLVLRSVTFTDQKEAMKADLKLQAFAGLGEKDPANKPIFMNSPIGIDSIAKMFSP